MFSLSMSCAPSYLKTRIGSTINLCSSWRTVANVQKTLLQGFSSLLRIPHARGVFQGERKTASSTKGTISFSPEMLCLSELQLTAQKAPLFQGGDGWAYLFMEELGHGGNTFLHKRMFIFTSTMMNIYLLTCMVYCV
jgi:hypothetical protein